MASKKKSKKAKKAKKSKKAKSHLKLKKKRVAKKAKKTKKAKKKVGKKVAKKKAAKKKVAKKKPAVKKPAAPKPAAPMAPPAPVAPPGAERIGIVTHYYNHLSVAIIMLETGMLRSGETVHIQGHTSDFRQMVGSMEVDHQHVDTVYAGTSFGLRVNEHAREHDVVYRVTNP